MLFRLSLLLIPALLHAGASNVYSIQTFAGNTSVGDGGTSQSAILGQPEGLAADLAGNLYIADAVDCRVRKVLPSGIIQTVAGNGTAGFSGDHGPGPAALLNRPYGLALDLSGTLYVADLGNARVRRISPDGQITTVAGGGNLSPSVLTDGRPATDMKLQIPRNVAVDRAGNLYIADFGAHSIYRVDPSGLFYAVAGTGQAGSAAENATAKLSPLSTPTGLAVDALGVLYIADTGNNCIRKISAGLISTLFKIQTPTGLAMNSAGTLYVSGTNYFGTITRAVGQGLSGRDVAVDASGTIFLSSNNFVRKMSTDGSLSILAGSGASKFFGGDGGPASQARFHNPLAMVRDDLGNLFIADSANNRIRMIAPGGLVTTFAGTGEIGESLGQGQATLAQLNSPRGLALDSMRNLYVADTGNNRICKISPSGLFTVVVTGLNAPEAVAIDSSNVLFVADTGNNRIVTVSASGVLSTVTELLKPVGLLLDHAGDLLISESVRVSKLPPGGPLSTVLDSLNGPRGLALAADGSLVIAETGAQVVWMVSPAGAAARVAGVGTAGYSGDGEAALLAQLSSPSGVAADGSGNVWIADSGNQRIRELKLQAGSIATPLSQLTIANAASLMPGGVAPEEIVSIFGAGFDPDTTQVTFNGSATLVFYAGTTQINAMIPAGVKTGVNADLVVLAKATPVAELLVPVVAAAPAIFAAAGGLAAALNEDGSAHAVDNPAVRGSVVTLFATGMGSAANAAVTVTIGGYVANVLYAGAAPGFPGLNQLNVRVPGGFLAPGANQPVAIMVGNVTSSGSVSLAVR